MRSSCFVEQVMLPGGTLLSHLEIPRWSFLDPWIHSPPDPQWCAFRIRAIMFFRPRPFSCVLTARTIIEVNTNSPSYRDSEPLEPQNLVWWTFYQYYGTRLKNPLLASASSKEHCTVHRIQIVSAASCDFTICLLIVSHASVGVWLVFTYPCYQGIPGYWETAKVLSHLYM